MIVESISLRRASVESGEWPFTVPAVRQLASKPMQFSEPITFLVGANGSGKSTLVEGIAEAYGLDVRGGHGGRQYSSAPPAGPLGSVLRLDLTKDGQRAKRNRSQGFFLRAETAYETFNFMSDFHVRGYGERHLGTVSHGEGYLQVVSGRFSGKGLYLLDEPEAPLSFESCLSLIAILREAVSDGSQVVCATHSPILAALPDADIYEIGLDGFAKTSWGDLSVVQNYEQFLADPRSYLRHLL